MNTATNRSREEIEQEIKDLEKALLAARLQLDTSTSKDVTLHSNPKQKEHAGSPTHPLSAPNQDHSRHTLLLLADSALPLGSFAFSSGLESYLAHHKPGSPLPPFLELSVDSLATTALPYVLAAYRDPQALLDLDNDLDASTLCTVARRASVAQGRALLGVWERSFKGRSSATRALAAASRALGDFSLAMRRSTPADRFPVNGHYAPLWGVVCCSQEIALHDTAYVFLLNHAKSVVSAAVRASVLGPYAAQALLASGWLRGVIDDALRNNASRMVQDAGQCAPALDIWIGRHELLYSRIFNS